MKSSKRTKTESKGDLGTRGKQVSNAPEIVDWRALHLMVQTSYPKKQRSITNLYLDALHDAIVQGRDDDLLRLLAGKYPIHSELLPLVRLLLSKRPKKARGHPPKLSRRDVISANVLVKWLQSSPSGTQVLNRGNMWTFIPPGNRDIVDFQRKLGLGLTAHRCPLSKPEAIGVVANHYGISDRRLTIALEELNRELP